MRIGMKVVGTALCVALGALMGCSDDGTGGEDQEAIECCMLRQLASHCDSPNATPGLMQSVRDWRSVGDRGDSDACRAMINSENNGCSGTTLRYDEQDAVVDCQ